MRLLFCSPPRFAVFLYVKNDMRETTTNLYRTKDWLNGSLLYATGHTLDTTEWVNGVCYIVFEDEQSCEQTLRSLYGGDLMVNAKAMLDAIQTIKSIIRSGY